MRLQHTCFEPLTSTAAALTVDNILTISPTAQQATIDIGGPLMQFNVDALLAELPKVSDSGLLFGKRCMIIHYRLLSVFQTTLACNRATSRVLGWMHHKVSVQCVFHIATHMIYIPSTFHWHLILFPRSRQHRVPLQYACSPGADSII